MAGKRVSGALRDRSAWDQLVTAKFAGKNPVLSDQESIAAARRLYRRAMGKPFTGEVKITSGRRTTWVRRGVMSVNPNQRGGGLREIIHSISHYAHGRLNPKDAPHSWRQAHIEGDLADFAIKSGFLEGKLASKAVRPSAKPDKVQQKYAAMVKRRDKWVGELERAKRLSAKAAREVLEYERRHKDRLAEGAAPKVRAAPAKRLTIQEQAQALGLIVEHHSDIGRWWVGPADGDTRADPSEGEHYVDGREVRGRIALYREAWGQTG